MRHNFVEDSNFTVDMPFGEFIRKKRRLLGMNQTDFGALFGISKEAISKWELGATSPAIETARQILKILGADLEIINKGEIEVNSEDGN